MKTTFKIAYEERKPSKSLIFHTDRGSNYISKGLNDYLKSLQITHSFSRAYVPYDNSVGIILCIVKTRRIIQKKVSIGKGIL